MLRIVHTADWHLGHTLHGASREWEHQRFLDWLLTTLENGGAHALVIAGDIFDSANPPATAQRLFYRFLADTRRRCPDLTVVAVGGNHDSAPRLEAPRPLIEAIGVHVIGSARVGDNAWAERLTVPLRGSSGEVEGWCAAVPFLRPADLPRAEGEDPLVDGVRQVYARALDHARGRCGNGESLLAVGHCYMTGGQLSELSERKVLGGNQHALPRDLFPADVRYAALGHLHLAQGVGGDAAVRYPGSPIPLALDEAAYPHQVVQVDIEPGAAARISALRVPRFVEVLRLPEAGPAPLDAVLDRLRALDLDPATPAEQRPWLEVRVRLDAPEPGLRRQVVQALEDKPVRLLRVTTHYPGRGGGLADQLPGVRLDTLAPEEVFRLRYRRDHADDPPAELVRAFAELLEAAQAGEAA